MSSTITRSAPGYDSLPLTQHQGRAYRECLSEIHAALAPKTYFEIGTLNGDTLALSSCPSIAVDPGFRLKDGFPGKMPELHLFQQESDRFFGRHDPARILGRPLDFAFLDGMHQLEFLLRDFMHTERSSHRGGIIVMHDCVPLDMPMARREMHDEAESAKSVRPKWWAGDVWKILPILMSLRPDLVLLAFDAPPTGLIVIGNLDPKSRVLTEHYTRVVDQYLRLLDQEAEYLRVLRQLLWAPTAQIGRIVKDLAQHPGTFTL
jgi:hypothetical protein